MNRLSQVHVRRRWRRFGLAALVSVVVSAMASSGLGVGAAASTSAEPRVGEASVVESIDPSPGPFDFANLTGTDDLGRELSHHGEVSAPREDRYVGLFYFLWLGQHTRTGPYNITNILAKTPEAVYNPDHPAWGPRGAFHHWGESLFDYYFSDDAWVLRKHAQMLAIA
jgi:hypothetical protein